MESGLRPASTQLDNHLQRFALRLASLPKGGEARELIGAAESTLGNRLYLPRILGQKGRNGSPGGDHPLKGTATIDEETAAKQEAQRVDRLGLTIFMDGSRLKNVATGYPVT